jgi:hypothetical protein
LYLPGNPLQTKKDLQNTLIKSKQAEFPAHKGIKSNRISKHYDLEILKAISKYG